MRGAVALMAVVPMDAADTRKTAEMMKDGDKR